MPKNTTVGRTRLNYLQMLKLLELVQSSKKDVAEMNVAAFSRHAAKALGFPVPYSTIAQMKTDLYPDLKRPVIPQPPTDLKVILDMISDQGSLIRALTARVNKLETLLL